MSDCTDLWSMPTPAERLREALREGLLLRGEWRGRRNGREAACMLGWISREACEQETAAACPADVMPGWLAELTLWIDGAPSAEAWPGVVARFAGLLDRSEELFGDAAVCQRLDYTIRAICVRQARSYVVADYSGVLVAVDGVLSLLDRASTGDVAPDQEFRAAAEAAAEAALAAAAEGWAKAQAAWAAKAAWVSARAKPEAAARAAKAASLASAAEAEDDWLVNAILDAWERLLAKARP